MKKLSILAIACCLVIAFSCDDKEDDDDQGMSKKAEKNLTAVHAINDAIKSGDVSKLDSFITADAVDHAGMQGDIVGRDSIKQMLSTIHTMADNFGWKIVKEVADDDYTFQWMRVSGVSKMPDMGMPVGTSFEMDAIQVTRHDADGKAAEHWEFMLPKQMMQMMGGAGNQPPVKDTIKTR